MNIRRILPDPQGLPVPHPRRGVRPSERRIFRPVLIISCHATCSADFNQNGALNVQDLFDYVSAWFAGAPRADFNGTNGITVQDIFDFLAAGFAGS